MCGERALLERVTELEQEVRDVSSTSRTRIRWLEASSDQVKRRVEQLFRELEGAAPLKVRSCCVVGTGAPQGARACGCVCTCTCMCVSACV